MAVATPKSEVLPRRRPARTRNRPKRAVVAKRSRSDGARLEGVAVLLVEDDEPSRKLAALLLTAAGALVTSVASAEEALLHVAEHRPRVVVLDLVLPRMGGLVLLERLKTNPALRDVFFVAVTALDGPEVERMALEAGCAAYVQKPIDSEAFVAVIANCLEE